MDIRKNQGGTDGVETTKLDEKIRAKLGGTYISLRDGVNHYRLEGHVEGRPVVLLHGGTGLGSLTRDLKGLCASEF